MKTAGASAWRAGGAGLAVALGLMMASATAAADRLTYRLERALVSAGFDPGPIDGVFDARTQRALELFQRDRGLRITGQPDAVTLRALGLR